MDLKEISLKQSVAVVVGNQSARLKAISSALSAGGADTIIVTNQSSQSMKQLDGKAIETLNIDITNPEAISRLVDRIVAERHKIDILVNSTDLRLFKPFLEISTAEWHQSVDTILTSVFLWCQTVGRQMLKQKRGKIINISSGLAQRGLAGGVAYCAAQAGVQRLTQALALEWARGGIRVNAIGLGWFVEEVAADSRLQRYIPLGRLGTLEELTGLVVYLASDASEFVTGSCFAVDGGVMAHA